MTKITLNDVANLQNETAAVNTINSNSAVIETAFDNTLSRDGTAPNQMESDLDMNGKQILNLPVPTSASSAARLSDVTNYINSNPSFVGQYRSASVSFSSGFNIASDVPTNAVSLVLTPGDWDVFGVAGFYGNVATSVGYIQAGLNLVSAAIPPFAAIVAFNPFTTIFASTLLYQMPVPYQRVSVLTNTTIYLVVQASHAVNTMGTYGTIQARRVA